jgi:hypothetical protein
MTENGNNRVGFRFGSGGERREYNILQVKKALINGINEEKIIEEGELWFSRERLQIYITIAKRMIENESNSETATEYMKRKNEEKKNSDR